MKDVEKDKVKLLVCGGRDYDDRSVIYGVLSRLAKEVDIVLLIQGWCRGVDRIAHQWAIDNGVESVGRKYEITRSMWEHWGRGAGPRRNVAMYDDSCPDMVVAFPGGNGTAHMVRHAYEAGCRLVLSVDGEGRLSWRE